jgi:hypothetical protein
MATTKTVGRLFVALALFAAAGAAGGGEEAGRLTFLGSSLWTKAHDVEVRGPFAYCAFLDGLKILDLADARHPKPIADLHIGGGFAVALAGNLALVAAGDRGLAVVDVTDPKAPALTGLLDTPGQARDVAVDGAVAYVADGTGGVLAVDIAKPAAPKIVGAWDSPGEANGLALNGKTLFVADGSAGLAIVDISTPASPKPVGALDTDGTAESVALAGTWAYVADGAGGIKVVDAALPSGPRQTASLTASGYAHSVSASGKRLAVGCLYDGGFQILDITDPAAPVVLSTNKYTMYNEGWRVVLEGNAAIVIDYFSGIFFVDIADPAKPKVTVRVPAPSTVVAVCGRDRYAYAVGELSGVMAVDVADPDHPAPAGVTGAFRGVQGIAAAGDHVYVTDRWSIRVFDVSDPARPRVGKALNFTEGIPRTLVVRGHAGYLTADNFGFYTLDFTDPALPKIAGSFKLPGFTYGLAISGDIAYLANSDTGLHLIDVKKLEEPVEIAAFKLAGEPTGLAVRGPLAFVAAGPAGLLVVDVSRPGAPKVLGTAAADDFASAVVLDGDFAYIADGLAGVKKIDISDPASPRLVAAYDTPGEAQNLCVLGKTILVADTYSLVLLR